MVALYMELRQSSVKKF